MRTTVELTSETYGNFTIEESKKNKVVIWWDFYKEYCGFILEPEGDIYIECDIKDFTDLPKNGIFKTIDDAKEYITNKFGEVK